MTDESKPLSRRKQEILAFIVQRTRERGRPPTVREIGEGVGLASPSTVHAYIDQLCTSGHLRRETYGVRTIVVMQPPEGSEPEGEGVGKPWVPQPGVTFLAEGAFCRSLIDMTKGHEGAGLVGIDVQGKWNHGARDTLSIIVHPEVAEEWGQYLIDCAKAARADQARWFSG